MRTVFITVQAQRDLAEIETYLRAEAPFQADALLDRLEDACQDLAAQALLYPLFAGREDRGVGRRVVYPYNILYRLKGENVEIVHVLHGARDAERILFPDD